MDNKKLVRLNNLINKSYECLSFVEFLKLSIMTLHEVVMYDSGMFFCGISRDCSFFKPYLGGSVDEYYNKYAFPEKAGYLKNGENEGVGSEASVYKAVDYANGIIHISNEPRMDFITSQKDFHVVCIRIINKGQFMGEIYLHRSKDKPDFDEEDMFVLRLLQPHISTVFGIIHSMTAIKFLEQDNQFLSKKGMFLLDRELNILGGNATGMEMLRIPTIYGSSIFYHVKELCADTLAAADENIELRLLTEHLKTQNGELAVDVYLRYDKRQKRNIQFIIVMEFVNPEQKLADYKFKFTKREADIIDGIVQGKNNLQLATALNLSENTVKTHVKNIYRKAGANNRAELTYLLMLNK